MTRYERLMNSLKGLPVDRPPVSFYEINGTEDMGNPDPFNIYNDPSWKPLIELARERTDRIVQLGVPFKGASPDLPPELLSAKSDNDGSTIRKSVSIRTGSRTLSAKEVRERDVNTVWHTEHLLKGVEDLEAYLALPMPELTGTPDTSAFLAKELLLGDTGIVMVDFADPLCHAASLFSMEDYTIMALSEPELFHKLLARLSAILLPKAEAIAKALPERLWRIVGPEYASPPYLPPTLFREYVTGYDKPIVEVVRASGGFPRIHSHGRLKDILDHIVDTGCVALDPIEPPPQGDVSLAYVRQNYGRDLTLFGNLEASDIENLPTDKFAVKIATALEEGCAGEGRGFVLMPSACPYGRKLPALAMRNYEKMVEMACGR